MKNCNIYFCFRDCTKITEDGEVLRPNLFCDHEEADSMLVAYAAKVLTGGVMVRSPSGDIDIIALLVYHSMNYETNVYVDNGTGTRRKILHIDSCGLPIEQRSAIIGIHSFSGNDYLSSFFRKGKKTCWRHLCKNEDFVSAFSSLGSTHDICTDVAKTIEKYVCVLYGRSKLKNVNEVRWSIFWDKYNKEKKIIELCMLPPCFANFRLHLQRSNYVAFIMRNANQLELNLQPHSQHGWAEGSITWVNEYFPKEIEDVLFTANKNR